MYVQLLRAKRVYSVVWGWTYDSIPAEVFHHRLVSAAPAATSASSPRDGSGAITWRGKNDFAHRVLRASDKNTRRPSGCYHYRMLYFQLFVTHTLVSRKTSAGVYVMFFQSHTRCAGRPRSVPLQTRYPTPRVTNLTGSDVILQRMSQRWSQVSLALLICWW